MAKHRILFVIKGLGRGGAEQILASAAPYLDRTRFEYELVYLLPWKDALAGDLELAGVRTHCLAAVRRITWMGRFRRLVSELGIDLVHAHSPVSASVARTALRSGRPRLVYTEHNEWERYHPFTRWANALTFPRNDHVFAVSEHVRDSIRYPGTLAHRPMPPVEVLYHGIDHASIATWVGHDGVRDELGIPSDAPVVGTVANFKAHKRLDQLLGTADRVRREIEDVRFVFVGQGPLEMEMRQLARAMDLERTVVFAGFREDAPHVASTFDVFALSSEHEGLSIALLEALALGKPAVVTDVGGLTEIVQDGRQGFIVPAGDVAAMADRIVRLLRDPALRSRMGNAGAGRAELFDIRRAASRMQDVYAELLA